MGILSLFLWGCIIVDVWFDEQSWMNMLHRLHTTANGNCGEDLMVY